MEKRPQYSNAPITEAILDIRIAADGLSLADLAVLTESTDKEYPKKTVIKEVRAQISGGPDGKDVAATTSQRETGFVCVSADGKQVFQARLDGFSFSKLAPYANWESFREEAQRLWQSYRSAVKLTQVTRLAVRYVNRLDLPLPLHDFADYLTTVPQVGPGLPQSLAGYFMHLQIPFPEINAVLLLNEALVPPPRVEVASVVLDLDLFCPSQISPEEDDNIWNLFEVLHEKKNEIFEACITDRTRELIK